MAELNASVVIDLSGNLQSQARRMGGSLERLGQRGNAAFRGIGRSIGGTLRGLQRFGTSTVGLLTGGGLIAAGVAGSRAFLKIEERIVRLAVDANSATEDVQGLWEQIQEVAKLDTINVDPKRILGAVEQVVERTGDLEFARGIIESMGMAIQATGDEGPAIGALASEFQKMGLSAKESAQAFDIFFALGREGAFTLRDLANLGPRLTAAYSATGRSGVGAVRELAATVQLVRMGTGNAEQATTAVEAFLRTMQDAAKIDVLRQGGIQVFDPAELERGRKVMRPINELMVDIIERARGDPEVLSKIFDAEAMRAMNAAVAEFQRLGGVPTLAELMQVDETGAVAEASRRVAETASAKVDDAFSQLRSAIEEKFAPVATRFAEALEGALESEAFKALMEGDFGKLRAEIVGAVSELTIGEIDAGKMILGALELPGGGGLPGNLPPANTPEGRAARRAAADRLFAETMATQEALQRTAPMPFTGTSPQVAALARELLAWLAQQVTGSAEAAPLGSLPGARGDLEAGRLFAPEGRVEIEFLNPPPGLRVRELSGSGLDLDVITGPAMSVVQ